MALDYQNDVKFGESLYQTGTQAVTDGSTTVDLTADSPDLLSVDPGDTFWMDPSGGGERIYRSILTVNNATKLLEVNDTLPVDAGATFGTLDDADLAAQLAVRTAQDLPLMETRRLLRERQLWEKNPITRARDIGKIGAVMIDGTTPASVIQGLTSFAGSLYEESSQAIRMSSRLDVAVQLTQVMGWLQANNKIDADDVAAFLGVGGGLMHPGGVTAAEIIAVRTDHANRLASEALRTAAKTKLDEVTALAKQAIADAEQSYRSATYTNLGIDHANVLHNAFADRLATDAKLNKVN